MTIDSGSFISPDWPAPERVGALVTTKGGGVSREPYASFNLAFHVGDDASLVTENRRRLQCHLDLPLQPQWLQQVHGVTVAEAVAGGADQCADALITRQARLPCAVLTADCLPVFFCDRKGSQVAVAHAGWRGLAAGVLEATVAAFTVPADELLVWMGPAIGVEHFEVGSDVRDVFLRQSPAAEQAFTPNKQRSGHWFSDLCQLAELRLAAMGVLEISGSGYCTYAETEQFYSYRREGVTGRMASVIWLRD